MDQVLHQQEALQAIVVHRITIQVRAQATALHPEVHHPEAAIAVVLQVAVQVAAVEVLVAEAVVEEEDRY
jgi:hypothetical protein